MRADASFSGRKGNSFSTNTRARGGRGSLPNESIAEGFTCQRPCAILNPMPRDRKTTPAQSRPPGRPSIYSDELAAEVCGLVAQGCRSRAHCSVSASGRYPKMVDVETPAEEIR